MLTTKNLTAKAAIDYYTASYGANQIRWHGKGAGFLGLYDNLDDKQAFTSICNGLTPDGRDKLGQNTKRVAIDLTFSAPKSLSLSALLGKDKDLIQAHRLSVHKTLDLIEKEYICTRIRQNGDRHCIKTGNLIACQFDHVESRELDPHLHTHVLVMNLTRIQNGNWYSLHNGEIYRNKKILGLFYHKALQDQVQILGYETVENEGLFEIKGYSKQDLINFSKRRRSIIAENRINDSWKARENASLITRKTKQHLTLDELQKRWQKQALYFNIIPVVKNLTKETSNLRLKM